MEKQNYKLPQLFVKETGRSGKNGCYLVSADLDKKKKHTIIGEGGFKLDLIIANETNNSTKDRLPNEVDVEACFGDVDFPVGTTMFVDHYALLNHDGSSNHIFEDESGKKFWRVESRQVHTGLVDGNIVPNSDILVCEYIEDKLLNTTLELTGSLVGDRQDVARVVISNDDRYPVGTYILVEDYALYSFVHEGKKMAKVDISMNDIICVVSSPLVRKPDVLSMTLANE